MFKFPLNPCDLCVSKWQFVLSIDFTVMYRDLVLGLFLRGMLDCLYKRAVDLLVDKSSIERKKKKWDGFHCKMNGKRCMHF